MPSIYKQSTAENAVFWARIKVVDLETGKFKWKRVSTMTNDAAKAMVVAKSMEDFANKGIEKGGIDRSEAEAMVDRLLSIIGQRISVKSLSLFAYGDPFIKERCAEVGASTARKYEAHWSRAVRVMGNTIHKAMDSIDVDDMKAYYNGLLKEFSATTANDHIRTLAMIYLRANASGHAKTNPLALLSKQGNDSVEKAVFTRAEMVKLLRFYRENKAKYERWLLLSLLGWYTGHRFEDLQNITSEKLKHVDGIGYVIEFVPEKKDTARKQGRAVTLPIERHIAKMILRLGGAYVGNNRNGIQSDRFIQHLEAAGIKVERVERGKRSVALKSFHSFRHTVSSRLVNRGVEASIARKVTDHDSEQVHNRYVHTELAALKKAMKAIKVGAD